MTDPAPLLSIPEAEAPANGGAAWFQGRDGARLRAALFHPDGPPRGSAVLSPGRTEPIEKYFEVVRELQARGFVVLVHDWRGHGLSVRMTSDPMKGHTSGWRVFIRDFKALLGTYEAQLPKPWIALSHSMGAGLTLLALVEGEDRFEGAVFTSPMLTVNVRPIPPAVGRGLCAAMVRVGRDESYVLAQGPNLVDQPFESNILTHDRGRWDRMQAQLHASPELQLGGVTWGWLNFAMGIGGRIAGRASEIRIPMTLIAAGDERLCDNGAVRALAARASDARYVEIPGAFHELLMETDDVRAKVWAEFDALADRVAPRPQASASASRSSA